MALLHLHNLIFQFPALLHFIDASSYLQFILTRAFTAFQDKEVTRNGLKIYASQYYLLLESLTFFLLFLNADVSRHLTANIYGRMPKIFIYHGAKSEVILW